MPTFKYRVRDRLGKAMTGTIELENAIKKMTTYIEPALTLLMGIVVLFLALAVFLPWWNVSKLFR